jgi:hypothetical protein
MRLAGIHATPYNLQPLAAIKFHGNHVRPSPQLDG